MKSLAMAAIVLALAVSASCPAWAEPAGAPTLSTAAAAHSGEVIVNGKVDAVTVYRGQALVTRLVELPAGDASGEIVVSDLPERVVPGTIFAEGTGDAGVEVRSVRYRERPVGQDVREDVRKLDDQIVQLNDKLAAVAKQQQVLQEERGYMDKLSNFTAPTATTEMTKGVLNADQLKQLTAFQFDQRKAIGEQELKLQQDQRDLTEQLSVVQRQRSDVSGRSSRTVREAVVFVNRKSGGSLRLHYLVDGAGWSPSYNIRADAARKSANVEYEASIQQMSGEDWNNVTMTLSTATPNLVAAAPELSPLFISLVARPAGDGPDLGAKLDYRKGKDDLAQRQQHAELERNMSSNSYYNGNKSSGNNGEQAAKAVFSNVENDRDLNGVAAQLQVLELVAGGGGKQEDRHGASNEGIVVTYDMRARTSLPSRADQQLVQIDTLAMKSDFYKVAVPVLTSYVYDEATLTNTSKVVLLAGPVASYVGRQFVGNGALPTVAVGQPFTVGFGIDASLRASRERLDKTETMQGGNRVTNYTYRLAVDNFGEAPANVRLMDRLPAGKDSEVRVTFVDAEGVALSGDKQYQQGERKKGILRWDVVVPGKSGTDAFSLTYKMNMEYDRNLAIAASSVLGREEIEKLLTH